MIAISMYGPVRRRTVRRNRTGGMPEPLLGDSPDKTTPTVVTARRDSDYNGQSAQGGDETKNTGSSLFQAMIGGPFGNAGKVG